MIERRNVQWCAENENMQILSADIARISRNLASTGQVHPYKSRSFKLHCKFKLGNWKDACHHWPARICNLSSETSSIPQRFLYKIDEFSYVLLLFHGSWPKMRGQTISPCANCLKCCQLLAGYKLFSQMRRVLRVKYRVA